MARWWPGEEEGEAGAAASPSSASEPIFIHKGGEETASKCLAQNNRGEESTNKPSIPTHDSLCNIPSASLHFLHGE